MQRIGPLEQWTKPAKEQMRELGHFGALPRTLTLQRATLVFIEAAPNASVLSGFDGPTQAQLGDITSVADFAGLFDLHERWASVPDRKKQFRFFLTASGLVTPVHASSTFRIPVLLEA